MPSDAHERSRRKLIGYAALALAVIVVATLGLTSIYGSSSSASTGVARTVTVTRGTVQSSVSASGNTSAVSTANENFATSGTLTAVNVAVGDTVTAGEVLATIDSAQAKANLQSAEASLASAQTTLAHDQAGGTPAQQAQNQASLVSAQQQLVTDQNQLDCRSDQPADRAIDPGFGPSTRVPGFVVDWSDKWVVDRPLRAAPGAGPRPRPGRSRAPRLHRR